MLTSPFIVDPKKKPAKGVDTGDLYYHTADILQVIEDNQIKLVVEDNKELISDVINANADKCGLKNILRLYAKTGDVTLFQQGDPINGIDVANLPTESVQEIANKLPKDLVGDDIGAFLKSITAEDLIKYYQSKQEVKEDIKDVKEE